MKTLTIFFMLLLSSCAVTNNRVQRSDFKDQYVVEIVSIPEGAIIEINGGVVGQTPMKVDVPRESHPIFGAGKYKYKDPVIIKALPLKKGHCVQVKYFGKNQDVPKKVLFMTGLCPDSGTNQNIIIQK